MGVGDSLALCVYNNQPVKFAAIASMVWGIAGFLVGVIIAFQLWAPELNMGLPYTTFGRLRPLHTSAVIFAFGGNVLIATSLYVVQRTGRARLAGRARAHRDHDVGRDGQPVPGLAVQPLGADALALQQRQRAWMHRAGRVTARAHRLPAIRRQVVEGGLAQNRAARIAGTEEQHVHDSTPCG